MSFDVDDDAAAAAAAENTDFYGAVKQHIPSQGRLDTQDTQWNSEISMGKYT